MKRLWIMMLAAVMVLAIFAGTAFAKPGKGNGKGNDKPATTQETKKDNKNDKNSDKDAKKAAQELKKASKEGFKAAVTPYLNKIKANKRAWGQAGGLDDLEDYTDDIESLLKKVIFGGLTITPEQLAAISVEVQNIKACKVLLRTEKRALQTEWKNYITAKKTYNIDAAVAALQKTIDIQQKRIEARKSIFASLAKIVAILKEAINTQPAPSTTPSPEPSASVSPSPEPSPSV